MDKIVGIGEFRQRATEIIRAVEDTAQPVQVARRGRPVVEIRPLPVDGASLLGSVVVAPGIDLTEPVVAQSMWEES